MKRVYIGNFPYDTTEQDLRTLFAPRKIVDVHIVMDRETGNPRGFGFVEFESDRDALDVVHRYNGATLGSRALVVGLAREKQHGGGNGDGKRRRKV